MNLRKTITFGLANLLGYNFPALYAQYLHEVTSGDPASSCADALRDILLHSKTSVPYYAELLAKVSPHDIIEDPEACLRSLPILTKDIIRAEFDRLKANDLSSRRWYYNTSGGSTGIPVKLIQDKEYRCRVRAITMLFSHLVGRDEGEPVLYLWGSEREILESSRGIRAQLSARLFNTSLVNAFYMTPHEMRDCLERLDRKPPKLIIAYAQSLYELARFARREGITITAQHSAMTSAGTLYEFMRDEITGLLKCPVYNRYGSREVSAIACERPGLKGLWVAPWGSYVEVIGPTGGNMPPGAEGDLLITCLTNHAMPLLRYQIGDRGVLASSPQWGGQVLHRLLGRSVDSFRLVDGTCVDGEYFTHLLYFRDWVHRFQIIQPEYNAITMRIQLADGKRPSRAELAEIESNARAAMGHSCRVNFEFPTEIQPSPSGKFRFTISEVR